MKGAEGKGAAKRDSLKTVEDKKVGKASGEKRKSLSADEKAPYEAKSAKRKFDYEKLLSAYNKKQQENEKMLETHTGLSEENEAVDKPDKPQVSSRFTWIIENFSRQTKKKLYSDTFVVDGYKWRVLLFPKGNYVDHLSMYLAVANSSVLPSGWNQFAEFSLAVVNQMDNKLTIKIDLQHNFHASDSDWGLKSFIAISDLYDPSKGFLLNDKIIIEADVVRKTEVDTPSKKQAQSVEYDENLVGSRIKIWWPEDETYYFGVIKSFNCIRKKHKLLYDDGEEELLNLKTEKWDLVENVSPKSDGLNPPLQKKQKQVSSSESDIICVQGYNVKNNIAPILEAIFKKHGDIAAKCIFKIASVRTSFLEVVCEVVKRIQTDDIKTIISEIGEIECQVSEAEAANVDVTWLRAYLAAVHKGNEEMKKASLFTEMKVNTILVKKSAQMDLKERREELVAAQELFEKAERCVKVLDLVEKKLSDNILEAKAENYSWVKQPIL